MFSLPFDNINSVSLRKGKSVPLAHIVRKGEFSLQTTGDTYLDMSNWGKGSVWVNGHHLGRYWNVGPQQTIYLPAEWLKQGKNEVVILELLKPEQTELTGIATPI